MDFIEIDGIKIQTEKKRIKNFNLKVSGPYGEVKLTYPYRIKKEECYDFIQSKLTWIKKQQNKYKNVKIPKPLAYETGEKLSFLGEKMNLNVELSSKRFIEIYNNQINLGVLKSDTKKEREELLYSFYRIKLYDILFPLVNKWEPIMQVKVNETRIKNMKTLWGSCNIQAHRIWLNLQLVKYDFKCIEYVVVHEMVHLLERLHSPRFYRLMDEFLPDWRTRQKLLNQKKI